MSAKQPNRKPTGKRKESDASAQEGRERKRAAKRKGLKAGSRQQVEQAGKKSSPSRPRIHASVPRKPIALIADEKGSKAGGDQACEREAGGDDPEQELASIENDDRLNDCWIVWMPVKPWRPQSRHGSISGLTVIRS